MSACEKDWIDTLSALLTPTIAVIAVGIAGFQLWLANTKMKFDLFDRRYAIYSAINSFIGATLSAGNSTQEMQRDFLNATNSARFLFGPSYAQFIKVVWEEVVDLEASCVILKSPGNEVEKNEHIHKRAALKKSLAKRLGELNELSEPYLKLSEIIHWPKSI